VVPGAPSRGELLVASGWVANPPNLYAAMMFRKDNGTAGELFSKQLRAAPVRRGRNSIRGNTTMMDKSGKSDRIFRIAYEQQHDFLRRSSLQFLECPNYLRATNMSISELAARLEKQA
jgi:hypothetical protein